MSSCRSSTMFIGPKTSVIIRRSRFFIGKPAKFRCLLSPILPEFAVTASLSSVLSSGNMIAAAAGSSTAHGAVTSAITQVAVTAVAIASGACLSTKVEFLWPKVDEQPGSHILDGVDVTGYPIFNDAKVQKAIAFARKAHHVDTIVAGILHDIVDDTCESLDSIEREFDSDAAKLVAGVSRLSYINQLLRRRRRMSVGQDTLNHEEANNLRAMLLGMVDDPRVVLIKLADRLHNMRTIYALPPSKAQAVAQETLAIWCSLASRLGLWALKAELEDLCFAVLQPKVFRQLRADLVSMWSPSNNGNLRRISTKSSGVVHFHECEESGDLDEENSMKVLLQAVLPFDLLLDRKKRVDFSHKFSTCLDTPKKPKVVRDAGVALASLVVCEEALERELFISTSYVPGMEVSLSGRLKSLYSIYSKMIRKDVGIRKVYDARALRVIVGDKNGTLHGQAKMLLAFCFFTFTTSLADGFLWSQSLHTAVQGPDSSPLEVQIRTQRMHEYAEHGLAAHWLYKEAENILPSKIIVDDSNIGVLSDFSEKIENQASVETDMLLKYSSLKVGHPVLRVEAGQLLAAVIVSVDNDGRELLVAVGFGLAAYAAVAERRSPYRINGGAHQATGIGVLTWKSTPFVEMLKRNTITAPYITMQQDQFERCLPTFIQVIELTEWEEAEYWAVVSAVFEGKPTTPSVFDSNSLKPTSAFNSALLDTGINNKVQLLRTMLQWEEQLRSEAGLRQLKFDRKFRNTESLSLGEVAVVCWPHGEIMRLRTGSTAGDAARRIGFDGKLVSINGQLVLPNTELKDGDVVEVRL
ncbi:hypothetical protein SASPL_116062 [Salvia splendens]|uniref:RelA/SpoT domain-containing protein n=1 Tax=Salvia splendens TaxID=180675 RepID=A0A8X8Y6L1_SALSN|nr:hypothetical protein SASPL_116062 [Salvia splendens]